MVLLPRREGYPYCTECQHGGGCVHCFPGVPRHTFGKARQNSTGGEQSIESGAPAPPTPPPDPREHEQ